MLPVAFQLLCIIIGSSSSSSLVVNADTTAASASSASAPTTEGKDDRVKFRRGADNKSSRRDKYYPPPPTRNDLPLCPKMNMTNLPKYHQFDQCDAIYHNSDTKRSLRHTRYHSLLQTGVLHIPDEKTIRCPAEGPIEWQSTFGHDTKWLVENQSSRPAVVIYVDASNNGKEYSAFHPDVHPPHHDPDAILQPGEFVALDVFEGHIFYVRELLDEGQLGDILLQHQPGLIAIQNRYGLELSCEKPKLPPQRHLEALPRAKQESIVHQALERIDPEPKTKITPPPKKPLDPPPEEKRHPEYERSPSHREELCHTIYKGFRNTIDGCPLHMYYAGMLTTPSGNGGGMVCAEEFKFHLGLHSMPDDYMFDWHSKTKFESSYVGHTFHARLASDPKILVDSYTLQPTIIHDCPSRKKTRAKATESEVGRIGTIQPIGLNLTAQQELLGGNTTGTQGAVNVQATI